MVPLKDCCTKFLNDFGLSPPPPPVKCKPCGASITYDRVPIKAAEGTGDYEAESYSEIGYSIVNPTYME